MPQPSLSPLWELTKMRLREFYREKGIIFWVFAFPLLMALGLGIAFRSRPPERPHVAVIADSPSPRVSLLAEALKKSERLHAAVKPEALARRELSHAKVDLIVRLEDEGAEYFFDRTQDKAPMARLLVDQVLQSAAGRRDVVPTQDRVTEVSGSRYIDFLIPGLIGMNLMSTSMWGVGYNLVLARKRKLLRRFAVTPMNRAQFLLSYFFSRSLFLLAELSALVFFGWVLFGTVIQGSYVAFTLIAYLGAASFAGISLLIGARIENTEAANGWMNLVQLPMWVLSGAFFSYERFPEWLHGVIRLLPLTALNDALRAVFNDGASLLDCGAPLLVLVVWGLAGFGFALKTFRWQ